MASPAVSPGPDTTAAASAALGTTAEPPPGADRGSQKGDDVILYMTALGGDAGVGMTPAVAPSSASDQVQRAPGGATGVANSGASGPGPGGPPATSGDAGVGMTPAVAPSSASDQVQRAPGGATGVANSGASGPGPGGPPATSGDAGVGMTPAVAPSSASDQVQGASGVATAVANSGASGPGPGGPPATPVDAISASLEAEIVQEMAAVPEEEQQPWIWRVHPSIRAQEDEAYGPKLVSIGPLHHGEDILLPMEQIKLMYLKKLLGRSVENNIGNCIRAVRECEPQARRQYAEKIDPGVKEFVKMLVLDGCFIIEYFVKRIFKETRQNAQLSGVRWGFSHLRRDLMLLENQIPFLVLVRLFEQCTIPFTGARQTPLTLIEITLAFLGVKLPRDQRPPVDQIHHLLHLHHLCLDPSRVLNRSPRCSSSSCCNLLLYPIKNPINSIMFVFLALFYLLKIHKWHKYCCPTEKSKVPRMIPCAAELLTAGVKFKKDNNKVSSLVKVSFTDGILEIPVLRVQESTSSELRNLIALEQCCPQVGSYFTSYAVFMDNLIDTECDVAILKKYGILESKLGNDEEVAKMFNTLCKGTHLNYEKHSNASVFSDLNAYFNVPHHKWRASLKSTYFSNPWNIISLFAGIVLLFLTAVQSYFTVFPRNK